MMAGPGATNINMQQNQPHQVSIHKQSINIQELQISPSVISTFVRNLLFVTLGSSA